MTQPADFGSDISCVTDIDISGRSITGNRLVSESVARRWITPRGRLIRYPNYGFDITGYLNSDVSPADIAEIQAMSAQEALKDERVLRAKVAAAFDAPTGSLQINAEITTANGPFRLVVNVTALTLEILSIT